jgi:hypothetical protein
MFQFGRKVETKEGKNTFFPILSALEVELVHIILLSHFQRLRGRGSGYLEGANKTESPEPLHLCISCMSWDGYQQAVASVKALMDQVYQEYV